MVQDPLDHLRILDAGDDPHPPAAAPGNPCAIWYAFASVAAAANRSADALGCLHEAVTLGYKDVERMQADEDLKNLRDNAQFRALVAELAPHGTGNLAHTTR